MTLSAAYATRTHFRRSSSTNKERDSESGNDYFEARYYNSATGRFLSPDPVFATPERLADPQEWNLYSYVRNNPLAFTDPTGLDMWLQGCGDDSKTCQGGYLGSTDKNGKFSRTHLSGDQSDNASMDENGNVTYGGKTYKGKWDTNKDEQGDVTVSLSGDMDGFTADITGSCQGTCVLSGTINVSAEGGEVMAQAGDVRGSLAGKSDWFANNNDPFHRHGGKNDTSFNSHVGTGQPSLDVTVPQNPSLGVEFHVNSGYPFEDAYQMTRHIISIVHTGVNAVKKATGMSVPN
jgi:RHS repeat-associated protein